jgi:hypothetical protein
MADERLCVKGIVVPRPEPQLDTKYRKYLSLFHLTTQQDQQIDQQISRLSLDFSGRDRPQIYFSSMCSTLAQMPIETVGAKPGA